MHQFRPPTFKSRHSVDGLPGNFDTIMDSLRDSIGGFDAVPMEWYAVSMANNTKRLKDQEHLFIGCPELPEGYYYRIYRVRTPMSIYDYRLVIMQRRRLFDKEITGVSFFEDTYESPEKMIADVVKIVRNKWESMKRAEEARKAFVEYIGE